MTRQRNRSIRVSNRQVWIILICESFLSVLHLSDQFVPVPAYWTNGSSPEALNSFGGNPNLLHALKWRGARYVGMFAASSSNSSMGRSSPSQIHSNHAPPPGKFLVKYKKWPGLRVSKSNGHSQETSNKNSA